MRRNCIAILLVVTVVVTAQCSGGLAPTPSPYPRTPTPTPPMWFLTLEARWTANPNATIPFATNVPPPATPTPKPTHTRLPFRFPSPPPDVDTTRWAIQSTLAAVCTSSPIDSELSPDRSWQAISCLWFDDPSRYRLLILRRGTSSPIAVFDSHMFGHDGASVYPEHWSTDGTYLYVGGYAYGHAYVPPHDTLALFRLDLNSGAVATILPPAPSIYYEVAFSPDDSLLAYAEFGLATPTLGILGVPSKSSTVSLDPLSTRAGSIAWWRDSTRLAIVLYRDDITSQGELLSTTSWISVFDLKEAHLTLALQPIDQTLWIESWVTADLLRIGIIQPDQDWDEIAFLDISRQSITETATETPYPY